MWRDRHREDQCGRTNVERTDVERTDMKRTDVEETLWLL